MFDVRASVRVHVFKHGEPLPGSPKHLSTFSQLVSHAQGVKQQTDAALIIAWAAINAGILDTAWIFGRAYLDADPCRNV